MAFMASTKNYLYSVGPGSIGPGTHITQSLFDPQRNNGVITRMHEDNNGITPSSLASLYTLSEPAFPGTAVLLDRTYVRQISNNLAAVVSYYGSDSSGSGFKTVMTRTPGAYRQEPYWKVSESYTEAKGNYIGPLDRARLRPQRILTIPMMTIRWSSTVFMDSRPNDNQGLIGKVNSNGYSIDGYSHAAETLRFEGTSVRHDKHGGYDRWTLSHTATYDPRYKHRTAIDPIPGETARDGGTWPFTLANNGDGEQLNPTASFPNLA